MTLRLAVLSLLLVAVPAWTCVPDPPTESPQGADAAQASRILQGVEDVAGRPTSIPAGMGGAINIGTNGDPNNPSLNGGTSDLSFTGATGSTQGTAVTNPDGSITITPTGNTDFTEGRFDNGREGRDITPGNGNARTTGGTIELLPKNPSDPNDPGPVATTSGTRVDFEGNGKVKNAGNVEVNGGTRFTPGSPSIRVDPGRDRLDSNVVYGED